MNAALRGIGVRAIWTLALLVLAGVFWIVVGFVTTTPESAARDAATMATANHIVPGSFHVIATASFRAGKVVVYDARIRPYGHMPAMQIRGEQFVQSRFGHWGASSGGWGGPVRHSPKDVANVDQTTLVSNGRLQYTATVVQRLSSRARTLVLVYKRHRIVRYTLSDRPFVDVTAAPATCGLTILDTNGDVVWPVWKGRTAQKPNLSCHGVTVDPPRKR
jgi:hypothetical protein